MVNKIDSTVAPATKAAAPVPKTPDAAEPVHHVTSLREMVSHAQWHAARWNQQAAAGG